MTWALDFAEVCAIIFGCAHFFTGLGVFLRPKAMSLFVFENDYFERKLYFFVFFVLVVLLHATCYMLLLWYV